ncbi:hypothetical protein FIBSPDRAFT_854269 [Athelia psychrophila]|uniref:Membrane-associated proteins in eicosanoid and glutathione metabolism n=1 Tax=Athelia psychrophila TaxID=1759441 RepID=A0A166Q9Z2_9AGAM|nr:hypothetical protein FIBSPDRAFT_854269 [Fibularhizoctonia sp. CBS 109695]
MANLISSPLSLYSIPVVWLTAFIPAAFRNVTIGVNAGYNNVAPRGNAARLAASAKVSKDIAAKVARMDGAHHNGIEQLPIWFAAVIVANYVGLEHETINKASLYYIAVRTLFNIVYIKQTTRAHSAVRSLLFFAGLAAPMYLLISAANKANA